MYSIIFPNIYFLLAEEYILLVIGCVITAPIPTKIITIKTYIYGFSILIVSWISIENNVTCILGRYSMEIYILQGLFLSMFHQLTITTTTIGNITADIDLHITLIISFGRIRDKPKHVHTNINAVIATENVILPFFKKLSLS